MSAFELTDDQLEMVAGGNNSGNTAIQLNEALAPTNNVNLFSASGSQSGSSIDQSNSAKQKSVDVTKITKTFVLF
jgi:hypothetical protein